MLAKQRHVVVHWPVPFFKACCHFGVGAWAMLKAKTIQRTTTLFGMFTFSWTNICSRLSLQITIKMYSIYISYLNTIMTIVSKTCAIFFKGCIVICCAAHGVAKRCVSKAWIGDLGNILKQTPTSLTANGLVYWSDWPSSLPSFQFTKPLVRNFFLARDLFRMATLCLPGWAMHCWLRSRRRCHHDWCVYVLLL